MKILENEIGRYPRVGDKMQGYTIINVVPCMMKGSCLRNPEARCPGSAVVDSIMGPLSVCCMSYDALTCKYELSTCYEILES